MTAKQSVFARYEYFLLVAVAAMGVFVVMQYAIANGVPSSVTVDNAAPTVSTNVNNANDITLTPNTTTNVNVYAVITDNNGCADLNSGTTTILLYRSGITSSSCMGTQNSLNCYKATAFTVSSTCTTTFVNTTTTFAVQYFAQATDASSSFSAQNWMATVIFKDPSNVTSTADSVGGSTPDVLTLNAINVTTSSINYYTVPANTNTGATNQIASSTNAGNSSTTLKIKASATLTSGVNSITTSSQHYATSTFTFGNDERLLAQTDAVVDGFLITAPTSTVLLSQATYWGLAVPGGTATGTYSGTTVFTSVWVP